MRMIGHHEFILLWIFSWNCKTPWLDPRFEYTTKIYRNWCRLFVPGFTEFFPGMPMQGLFVKTYRSAFGNASAVLPSQNFRTYFRNAGEETPRQISRKAFQECRCSVFRSLVIAHIFSGWKYVLENQDDAICAFAIPLSGQPVLQIIKQQ